MEMVYCRDCAKGFHKGAKECPGCGAAQGAPAAAKRNVFKLILLGLLYSAGFWFASMLVAGMVVGAMDPANAQARGEQAGQMLSGPFLLAAIGLAVALTVYGKLPGTGKPA